MPDNNIIKADHSALKRVIRPTRGFQRMKTASATLKGFEVMRMIRRGRHRHVWMAPIWQCDFW
jgi:transposase-like protein